MRWKLRKAMTDTQLARAKVNLCLHVTGQRSDGYHLLDSIVAFAQIGDELRVCAASQWSLKIDGPFAAELDADPKNLVLRAASSFQNSKSAALFLTKNLPVASGLGGGSADAAAALRGLAALWDCDVPDKYAQLALGADVPVCVFGKPSRMREIGEQITGLEKWPSLCAVLVNPNVAVSTATIFDKMERKNNAGIQGDLKAVSSYQDAIEFLHQQRNDLADVAQAVQPEIGKTIAALNSTGADLVRMSGSGATCFGLYPTMSQAAAAAEKIRKQRPDWWVEPTELQGNSAS